MKWDRYAFSWIAGRDANATIKSKYKKINRPFAGVFYRSKYGMKMSKYPPFSVNKKAPIYSGNAYNVFARDFLEWTFSNEMAHKIIEWSRDTFSPDEMVWATLINLPYAPGYGKKQVPSQARKIMWGRVY